MMVAWAANELPNDTIIDKTVSNDGLWIVFIIIFVAGLLPICAIVFGSAVRRILRRPNADIDSINTSSSSRTAP